MSNSKENFNMADLGSSLLGAVTALNAKDRANLVNALKNKLQNLAGQHPNVLENLIATLEAKYQKLYQPLYSKRYDIVNGVVEVDGVTKEVTMDQEDKTEEKVVSDFWLTAMRTNEVLAEEISERDEGALKYIKDIKWCRIDNPKGFKLEFSLTPILISRIILNGSRKMLDSKLLKKKARKGSKNAKPITKIESCESFSISLQNQMEQDYDIGEVAQGDEFGDMEDDEDEDDEDEEDSKAVTNKSGRAQVGDSFNSIRFSNNLLFLLILHKPKIPNNKPKSHKQLFTNAS
ncbi:hypothetical protein AAG906_014383 [Vitis piasezkii]